MSSSSRYSITRDGTLQYRSPDGWLDASGDSSNGGHILWLVRNDYAATIGMLEVFLDEATKTEALKQGVRGIARFLESLSVRGNGVINRQLESFRVNDMTGHFFDYTKTDSSDTVRVLIFEIGGRVYEMRVLVVSGRAPADGVFPVALSLLGSLRQPLF